MVAALVIDSFRGKYEFLSNFYPAVTTFAGIEFPTSEHAYAAAKTRKRKERLWIASMSTPGKAKKAGYQITCRPDWDDVRISAMELVVQRKFEDPELRKRLLATNGAELIEANSWGDKFWGTVDGEGENNLGKILMAERGRPTVHNLYKTPGWEEDPRAVYCGRPGKGLDGPWGNPWPGEPLEVYDEDLRRKVREKPSFKAHCALLESSKLMCFCSPKICHCDYLSQVVWEILRGYL